MISIQLWSAPHFRHYQKMRTAVQEAAAELGLKIELQEINDTERLTQSNPLDLPRLAVNGELIAVRNPPKTEYLIQHFQKA